MPYQYATEEQDYSHLSSGRVIYNLPGAPAFPVRMASEIFQRASALLGLRRRLTLFDPVCGAAYQLCALGFLHGDSIETIIASDYSDEAAAAARRNLGLLSPAGLQRRMDEIQKMIELYGKESHRDALHSADTLAARLAEMQHPIRTRVFQADALDSAALQQGLEGVKPDLVISDVPYGKLSNWKTDALAAESDENNLQQMLAALLPVLSSDAIVAIAADKRQKISHEMYRRISRFQIGKRQVAFLRAN
jgi:23S rRNA (guanine2535-N1)-methyltransferase